MVVGGWYNGGPAYETTTGAKLHWSPPNQPGNAFLEIKLPGGVTAVATDIWTVQPLQSSLEVVATTGDGKSQTVTVSTPARPAAGFVGFTSSSDIVSIRITPPKGQSGLIVDNFTIGKSSGRQTAEVARTPDNSRPVVEKSNAGSGTNVSPASSARDRASATEGGPSQSSAGTIAYVRGGKEIRFINPDGTGDRQFWTHPDLIPPLGIFELAWKPDGTELAFSSAHEGLVSEYMTDIYTIRRDGSNLRRITNPPERAGLARLPKGSVTVKVTNFYESDLNRGDFVIYVVGADEPQRVHLLAGASVTLTFKSVVDFGKRAQSIVAISGPFRWVVPGLDVIAGRNVTAPMFPISGQGRENLGAYRPIWKSDGSRISYGGGTCLLSSSSTTPEPGTLPYNPLFAGKNPMGSCAWDWGPTPATANQLIYSENSSGSNIYQITEGTAHPGTKLTTFSDLDYQQLIDLRWMPDGSGLLYSTVNKFLDTSNIFRYDFATKRTTQLTKMDKEFATVFSISPDSRSVVFERCPDKKAETGCEIWITGINGSGARLLVKDGLRPAWGK